MKKLLHLALITSLLLGACSSSGEISSDSETPRYVSYRSSDFNIEVPDTWETINQFDESYPDGMRVAFKNNLKDSSFTANVTIVREENPSNLLSADYAQMKLQNHSEHLLNYELISEDSVTLSVGGADSSTTIYTFTGKNSTEGPTLDFMQVVLCKADRAWMVTATYRPDEEDLTVEKLQHMLNSFEVR